MTGPVHGYPLTPRAAAPDAGLLPPMGNTWLLPLAVLKSDSVKCGVWLSRLKPFMFGVDI